MQREDKTMSNPVVHYSAFHLPFSALSVVIPSHSRPDLLRLCLASLTQFAPAGTQIIVVDDGSRDECVSHAAREFSGVQIVRRRKAGGFCVAANTGIAAATAPVVELLNDDTEVTEGWADNALAWFADERIAAVAPLVLQNDPTRIARGLPPLIDTAGDEYDFGGFAVKRGRGQESWSRGEGSEDRGQRSEDRDQKSEVREQKTEVGGQKTEIRGQRSEVRGQRSEVRRQKTEHRNQNTEEGRRKVDTFRPSSIFDSCSLSSVFCSLSSGPSPLTPISCLFTPGRVFGASACAAFYRRDALVRAGGFPEHFGAYFEDVDLSFRLRRLGFEIMYDPRAVVWHRVSGSYGQTPSRRTLERQSCNEERVFWRNVRGRQLVEMLPRHAAVLVGKALRRWQEGVFLPWMMGRLRAIMG